MVVPMPWCDICGGASFIEPMEGSQLTTSQVVPHELRILADERGGIIRHLFLTSSDGKENLAIPKCCTATIAPYKDDQMETPRLTGEGKGITVDDAIRSAIGEGLERYSSMLPDISRLTFTSYASISESAFDPRFLVLYEQSQYDQPGFLFSRFDNERPTWWVNGHWLDTGEQVQLPALATYLTLPVPRAEYFVQTTSSGLAAGVSFKDAARRALYELIERDAFMLTWLAKKQPSRIDTRSCDDITRYALSEVERLGGEPELYLIDVGTCHPTIVCLGLGDGLEWPGVTIGLAAHADPLVALHKAVLEHGHYGAYMRRLMDEGRHRCIREAAEVRTNLDHGLYYIDPSRVGGLASFRGSRAAHLSLADLRDQFRQPATLDACVACLLRSGIRPAAVDVTSPDVGLSSIRVARAFGTFMQPIHFGSAYRRLDNPRLRVLLSGPAETNPHPIA
jgi:ribosomal protein S12 methylthiotransferase accessory factor